jgi:hypothetical protein
MEDDLKNLKDDFLRNYWMDLTQMLNLRPWGLIDEGPIGRRP